METSIFSVSVMALFLFFCMLFLAILTPVIIVLGVVKILAGRSRKDKAAGVDEARMIQEIYGSLSKMEKRVEALETILLDREERRADVSSGAGGGV
jgi:phage shock protein B